MTQVYSEEGRVEPVTVVETGPCTVLQVKTRERDGYSAVQLGYDVKKRKASTKAEVGHAQKVKAEPHRFVREIRLDEDVNVEAGSALTVGDVFEDGCLVDVIGTSKGRGFAGVIKRWGFHGQRATHGVKRVHRAPGSIGRAHSTQKGTAKGKKMPGHFGCVRTTVRGLKLVRIDSEQSLLLIRGSIPGPSGGYVIVRRSNVKR
jgi:large subunit ribosomal protein L3